LAGPRDGELPPSISNARERSYKLLDLSVLKTVALFVFKEASSVRAAALLAEIVMALMYSGPRIWGAETDTSKSAQATELVRMTSL
jgi:hypothetical protein